MLCLTYNAGLRVSELVGLALDDLKMPGLDEVHIIGKGRRERILPPWKQTRRALRDWWLSGRKVPTGISSSMPWHRHDPARLRETAFPACADRCAQRAVDQQIDRLSPTCYVTLARSTLLRRPVTSGRSRSGLGTQAIRPPRCICRPIRPTSSIRSTSGALPASARACSRVCRTSYSRCSQAPETASLMGT